MAKQPEGRRHMRTRLAQAFLATAIVSGALLALHSPQAAANAQCASLKADFSEKIRPQFLRIVNRNRDVSAYFRNELRRAQRGDTPTRDEIQRAYTKTRGVCRNAACKTGAQAVYAATLRLYTLNRKWKTSDCPGYLRG